MSEIKNYKRKNNDIPSDNIINESTKIKKSMINNILEDNDLFFYKKLHFISEILAYKRLQKIKNVKGFIFTQYKEYAFDYGYTISNLGTFLGAITNIHNGSEYLYFTINWIDINEISLFRINYMDFDSIFEKKNDSLNIINNYYEIKDISLT